MTELVTRSWHFLIPSISLWMIKVLGVPYQYLGIMNREFAVRLPVCETVELLGILDIVSLARPGQGAAGLMVSDSRCTVWST